LLNAGHVKLLHFCCIYIPVVVCNFVISSILFRYIVVFFVFEEESWVSYTMRLCTYLCVSSYSMQLSYC